MAESDHRRGVTSVVAGDLLEPPVAATATTAGSSSYDEEEDDEEGFTFAAVPRLAAGGAFPDGRIGPVYPVFGRPRSPPLQEPEEDPGTATALVPLGQLLLEERGAPSGQPADDDGGLDGVPAETYCLWSPGASPAPGSRSPSPSPARCRKSGSTGSVLRWRHRFVGRSHSDGKEKFVFLDASSDSERNAGGGHGRMNRGRGGGGDCRKSTFLPYKQDLVGFFANAGALRRSYLPF
ncbi:hypothetical protein PAHAL_3G176300 [Panicum hallii]|jgi:hypothetical protein|uniref:DUF1645 domain-containing protein n=1 Tax=Panicum hallii TaxID=206008 RepID=A0A2S3H9W1_9POAL|nr:reticulon-4-like [Panicum hallii]PAN18076.1 hypothetical protein PAHAL_3G176300 [Panicum hallii]